MSTAEHYPDLLAEVSLPKHELLEIYHSKISIHRAKSGYDYPAIRLPFTFSKLAGLSTHIYQTVHEGALAFLVVVSSGAADTKKSENAKLSVKSIRIDMAELFSKAPEQLTDQSRFGITLH
jgi:hypothetical protein